MKSIGKSNLARLLLASLILSVTNGCATVSTEAVPLNSYCAIAKPISYDATQDTSETVREIEAHNSAFICICEADCPKGK